MEASERSRRVVELRRSFNELRDRLNYLRGEWIEAHAHKDVNRETELIARETELFDQVNNVITEFSNLMRYSAGPSGQS